MYDKPLVQKLYEKSGILAPQYIGVIVHMTGVMTVAGYLARKLNEKEQNINVERLETSAMLHDIGKAFNQDLMGHVDAGIKFLSEQKVDEKIVKLVEAHKFWSNNTPEPSNWEEMLVFFADMIFGQNIMPFRKRREDVISRYKHVLAPSQQNLLRTKSELVYQKIAETLPQTKL